ncbi:MAG: rod shape-determining protein MreD [Thermacetogeniaceae bacterium]|nr:rod shape-determining protein MreD [Syntrophomonadaceae bacterium]
MSVWRSILIAFSFFLALILQTTIFPLLQYKGTMPDLLLILIIFTALFSNSTVGGVVGFVIGFIQDLIISRYLGLCALSGLITGFTVGKLEGRFFKENPVVPIILVFVGTFLYNGVYFLGRGLCGSFPLSFVQLLRATLTEGVYNVVLSFLFYYPLMLIFHRIRDEKSKHYQGYQKGLFG